jgi:hypothetical protein
MRYGKIKVQTVQNILERATQDHHGLRVTDDTSGCHLAPAANFFPGA